MLKHNKLMMHLCLSLKKKGYKWLSGHKPNGFNYWKQNKESSCVIILSKYIIFMNIEQSKKRYPNIHIIEYKAKGESMTQEEMKHKLQEVAKLHEVAFDISVAIGAFVRSGLTVESDLQEAKSSAKNLIEKIYEYLEYQKPKFKVGDYVTFDIPNKKIAKIERLNGALYGLWYDTESEIIEQDFCLDGGITVRNATPTEILEYEMALAFHKHGRKPFEVKRGDVVYLKGYDKNIFLDSGNFYKKHNFIDGDVGLVKTVEEVNEWLLDKEKTEK